MASSIGMITPRRRRRVLIGIALGLVVGGAFAHAEVRYLLRAGYEEAKILLRRRPLGEAIADTTLDWEIRNVLALVRDVRRYAVDSLGLEAGDTYTSFADVGRDTLLLVVSASERYALAPYTWRYPIVGVVPYKGFFRPADARKLADRLEADGYDVYVREADAFSTLGWFEDPLLSTVLDRGATDVVATVVHEVAHNTLYVPSATPFNESFANFVGYRGAERFFQARGDTARAREAGESWQAQQQWMVFFDDLAAQLNSLYASPSDTTQLERERNEIFQQAREAVGVPDWEVNNAMVIARRFYRTNLEIFDDWLARFDGDLRRAVAAIAARVEGSDDPFERLSFP